MTSRIQRFLGSGDTLARLADHASRLRRLQTVFEQHVPPALRASCSVANLKDGKLVLLARGGAAAARLKQIAPTLVEQFAVAGVPVTAVQVKVQIVEESEPRRAAPERSLSDAGRRSLAELSATLPPDSPLRESLERLVRRSRPG